MVTDCCVHALLGHDVGNGAILTRNKQVCTLMSFWSHCRFMGEHSIFGTLYQLKMAFFFFLFLHPVSFAFHTRLFLITTVNSIM